MSHIPYYGEETASPETHENESEVVQTNEVNTHNNTQENQND